MGHLVVTLNKVAGEKHMKNWLIENGYSNISKENLDSKEYAFLADGKLEKIIVQVRAFSEPFLPIKLSKPEISFLTKKAAKQKLTAYAAYIMLDDDGNLQKEIVWERMSK